MPATASAQINARIEPELKQRGDAALAAAGLSPTQAIRALWELAARNENEPQAIEAALFPERAQEQASAEEARRQARMAAAQEGAGLASRTMERFGIRLGHSLPEISDDELKELAYRERYADLFEAIE